MRPRLAGDLHRGGKDMRIKFAFGVMILMAVAVLAVGLMPGTTSAQTTVTGAIAGTVSDPSGAAVADASVTLKDPGTGQVITVSTNASGTYQFSLLKPGVFVITAQHPGFKQTTESIEAKVGQTLTADIKLELGEASSTIEVTGAAPVLQTEDANISTTFNERELQNIPNPGNDITYVAQTAPGVTMNNSTLGGYGNFSAFGLPATANLFTINGNDYNDPFLNLNNTGSSNLLLGNNDIQEFTVVENAYTVQYGRQAGAQIDYTTKSGSNRFHGNATYNWTGRALNANDPVNKLLGGDRPFENNNQWAAQVAGPIIKNKAFFSVDYEGIRYIFGSTATVTTFTPAFESYVLGNVPLDAATQAFYNNVFTHYNAAPGIGGAAANGFPTSGFDAANPQGPGSCAGFPFTSNPATGATTSLPTLPANFQPGGADAGECTQSWGDTLSNGNKEWLLIGRVDYVFNENNKIYGRVKFDRGVQPTYTDPINPTFNNQSVQPQDEGQLNYTHVFSPNIVNNFIGSVLYYSAIFGNLNPAAALDLFPGNLEFTDAGMTALGTGSGSPNGFAAGFDFPQGRNVTQWGVVDDLSISRGNHAFKMGVNFRRDDVSDYTSAILTKYPVIQTTLLGFANDEISPVGAADGPGTVFANFTQHVAQPIAIYSFGLYFQDEYRVTSKLKMTLGLRAERNSGGSCQAGCATLPSSPFSDLSHGGDIPYNVSFGTGTKSILNVEKVVFEPRIGVAWTPVGQNTVIRAGIGMFSDLYPGVVLDEFTTNFPQVNTWSINPGTATVAFDDGSPASSSFPNSGAVVVQQCNSAFATNYAAGGNLPTLETAYGALPNPLACFSPTGSALVPNYNSAAAKILNPKYVEWNVEIQHSFARNFAFSANYVGNYGFDELLQNPYLNSFCDATCSGTALGDFGLTASGLPATAPDPRVGSVLFMNNAGHSNYNGITFSLQDNGWHGLSGRVNYSYSHAFDLLSNGVAGSTPFSAITSLGYQVNPFNPNANYGSADYDARHVLSAQYIYQFPFKSESRLLNAAIGGWQISGTFFWHSGFPFSIVDGNLTDQLASSENMRHAGFLMQPLPSFTQRNFPGNRECLGWLSGGPTCFDTTDFASTTTFTGDEVGRNGFRGPGFFGGDFSLRKTFQLISENRLNFEIGVNVFNVFNHANLGAPYSSTSNIGLPFGGAFFTATPPTSPYGAFAAAATDMRMAQIVGKLVF
jgi:Carboxypeptidase regulatory-like domain/TonB-dependent Receptor Plug Domain